MNNYQRDPKWANQILGFGTTQTIGNFGCTISVIGNILGLTPDVVNAKLKAVDGFSGALVIWDKIAEAFPGTQVHRVWTYNNDDVLANVPNVIIEVPGATIGGTGKHWIQGLGDGKCADPWTGKVRPTSDFTKNGAWTGYCIIKPPKQEEGKPCNERRDELWNFTKEALLKLGVEQKDIDKYSEKTDKLLGFVDSYIESTKKSIAGHQSRVTDLEKQNEKLTGELGVANEKKKIAEQALADEIKECSRRVTELETLLQEAKKDSPDLEKLVDEYEGMLGVERESLLQLQKKYDKARVDLARVTSQLKALPFIEKLKLLFL